MNTPSSQSLLRIGIVGPECTGKSDLAEFLARHYRTNWVPEYARGFIDNLVRPYTKEDLIPITHGQLRLEEVWSTDAHRILICDTTPLVIKIWSEFKFGECDPEILKQHNVTQYDLHLLTNIDVPWQDDPQREHPNERETLYHLYRTELESMKVPFVDIRGEREARRKSAIEAIDRLLQQ